MFNILTPYFNPMLYRKMHAWVWDDQAILLLKTLIPRKGELLRSSAASAKQGRTNVPVQICSAMYRVKFSHSDGMSLDYPEKEAFQLKKEKRRQCHTKLFFVFYLQKIVITVLLKKA